MIDYSHELKLHRSPYIRALLICVSSVFLALGFIGIFLPVLPTTPFLLVAAFCFARSSARFYNYLMNHRVFGPPLRQWVETRSVTRRTKFWAVTVLIVTLGTSIIFFVPIRAVQWGLGILGMALVVFLARLPTRPRP